MWVVFGEFLVEILVSIITSQVTGPLFNHHHCWYVTHISMRILQQHSTILWRIFPQFEICWYRSLLERWLSHWDVPMFYVVTIDKCPLGHCSRVPYHYIPPLCHYGLHTEILPFFFIKETKSVCIISCERDSRIVIECLSACQSSKNPLTLDRYLISQSMTSHPIILFLRSMSGISILSEIWDLKSSVCYIICNF